MGGFASCRVRLSWSHAACWTEGVAALPVHGAGYRAKPPVSGSLSGWSVWWYLNGWSAWWYLSGWSAWRYLSGWSAWRYPSGWGAWRYLSLACERCGWALRARCGYGIDSQDDCPSWWACERCGVS